MNKACTFLMVCLFVSLGWGGAECVWGRGVEVVRVVGGDGRGEGVRWRSGDNLGGPSPICVYPDTRRLAEGEHPHYRSDVSGRI